MIGYIAGKVLLKSRILISFAFLRNFEQTKWKKYFLNTLFLFIELREVKEKAELTFLFTEGKSKGTKKWMNIKKYSVLVFLIGRRCCQQQ